MKKLILSFGLVFAMRAPKRNSLSVYKRVCSYINNKLLLTTLLFKQYL